MAIDRTAFNALVDDSGTGTDGTIVVKDTIKTVLLDPIDVALAALAAQPRCVAYHNTTQALTATGDLALNSEDFDVGGLHDLAVNNARQTVPVGGNGYYEVEAWVQIDTEGTGDARVSIRKNGTTKLIESKLDPSSQIALQFMSLRWKGNLVAGDYVTIYIDKSDASAWTYGSTSRASAISLSLEKRW